jgi:hypothetical protein
MAYSFQGPCHGVGHRQVTIRVAIRSYPAPKALDRRIEATAPLDIEVQS